MNAKQGSDVTEMSEQEARRSDRMRDLCYAYVESHGNWEAMQWHPDFQEPVQRSASDLVDFLAGEIIQTILVGNGAIEREVV